MSILEWLGYNGFWILAGLPFLAVFIWIGFNLHRLVDCFKLE